MTNAKPLDRQGLDPREEAGKVSASVVHELDDLGSDYWWNEGRLLHVEDAVRRMLGAREIDFVDVGCGPGTLTEALISRLRPARALGLDATAAAVDLARSRGVPVACVDFDGDLTLPFAPNLVTCLDVLEHLDDPVRLLSRLRATSAPGALLVATVPALPALWSGWDELLGHRRRYVRGVLRSEIEAAGWRMRSVRYAFSFCVPPAWLARRMRGEVAEFRFPRVSRWQNRLLISASRFEARFLSTVPFGTSVVALAINEPPPRGA